MGFNRKKKISRRRFIGSAAISSVGFAVFSPLSSLTAGPPANLKLGFIGLGNQGMTLLNGFLGLPGIKVVAGCDTSDIKRSGFSQKVTAFYEKQGTKFHVPVTAYGNYADLLLRTDIDAVVVAVPDCSHARVAIAACRAGKDVYLETPMTFTFSEGRELRHVVQETGRILAVGNQLRLESCYLHAAQMVSSGLLGSIKKVHARWHMVPQTENGFASPSAANLLDVVQWATGSNKIGTLMVSFMEENSYHIEPHNINSLLMFGFNESKAINFQCVRYEYPDGVVIVSEPTYNSRKEGIKFIGEKGWIEILNNQVFASDERFLLPFNVENNRSVGSSDILLDFIDSVRERRDPAVTVESGHSSGMFYHLGNIAAVLMRPLKWDHARESFINDQDGEAMRMLQQMC